MFHYAYGVTAYNILNIVLICASFLASRQGRLFSRFVSFFCSVIMRFSTSFLVARQDSLPGEDRTTAITVASWTLMFITVVAFAARQITKTIKFRRFAIDDAFALTATIFAVGLSITAIVLASLGSSVRGALTTERANMLTKGIYASDILYISASCFTKLLLLAVFYEGLKRLALQRRSVFVFGCFVSGWSIASILAIAVQCPLPQSWDTVTSRCFDTRAFWITYCIIDSSTELLIIAWSLILVSYLKVCLACKVAIVACFASRTLVICAAILRLMWLYPSTHHQQPKFQFGLPTIVTQVQVCLSLCTACILYIFPSLRFKESKTWPSTFTRSLKDHKIQSSCPISSSLWFRRHKPRDANKPWDSIDHGNGSYEHVSYISPYLATPRPTSPLTAPRAPTRSSSKHGLCISIPLAQRNPEYDLLSTRTASSCALSPSCASLQPLLTPFVATRKAPSPPNKAYTPGSAPAEFHTASAPATHQDIPRMGPFSLFPLQQTSCRSPQHRQTRINSPSVASTRRRKRSPMLSSRPSSPPLATSHPPRSCTVEQLKSSKIPQPQPPPTTTFAPPREQQTRPESVQDLNSPMGAALNNFFSGSAHASPGGYLRNQQYLAPFTPIKETAPGSHIWRASCDAQRDGLFLPEKVSRERTMPVIKDARSKARVTVVARPMEG